MKAFPKTKIKIKLGKNIANVDINEYFKASLIPPIEKPALYPIKLVVNNEAKRNEREKFFIKQELQSILNLYAKMVSNGSWKDYSFTSGIKEVSFDVYQRASEKPVLRILKNLKPRYFNEKYLIKDKNGAILKKSENLNQLINKTSWNKLRLVK